MKPAVPQTQEDLWIWFDVLARFQPVTWVPATVVSVGALQSDRRDAQIMHLAQRRDRCPCCGTLYNELESGWGRYRTVIHIRGYRPVMH